MLMMIYVVCDYTIPKKAYLLTMTTQGVYVLFWKCKIIDISVIQKQAVHKIIIFDVLKYSHYVLYRRAKIICVQNHSFT